MQTGANTSETDAEAVEPDPRCSWQGYSRECVVDENTGSRSALQPFSIPSVIRPVRRTSVIVVRRTDELLCSGYKWAMIALLESMTRLESRFLVTLTRSSRVEKDGYSSHVFHRMTRDSSQSHFCKISEPLIDKPSLFACKEMIMFWSSNDQNWSKFSALTFKWCYTIS